MSRAKRSKMVRGSAAAVEMLMLGIQDLPDDHFLREMRPDEIWAGVKKSPDKWSRILADVNIVQLRYCDWCETVFTVNEIAYSVTTLFSPKPEYVCLECSKKTP